MKSMTKKKDGDRHTQLQFQIRLHPLLKQQLEKLAEHKLTRVSEEIRAAIRTYLEAQGFWPPGKENGDKKD